MRSLFTKPYAGCYKMKILIVKCFPIEVDLQVKTYNLQEIGLATSLLKMNNEVSILFYSKESKTKEIYKTKFGNINIYYQQAKVLLFKYFLVLKDFTKFAQNFDIIISQEYSQIDSYKLSKKFPKKTIIYHGPYYSRTKIKYNCYTAIYDMFFLRSLQKLKTPIYTKSNLAEKYLRKKHLNVVSSIGVGLDTYNFNTTLANNIETEQLSFLKKENWLLYVGKLEKRRNIIFLIDLLKKVNQSIDTKLLIIGQGTKKYTRKVMKQINKNCVTDKVKIIPKLEQKLLPLVYQNVSWLLLPTDYEIWGMVLMEAMYFNVKILTTSNGGSSSLIVNGENGYINKININEWASIICKNDIQLEKLIQTNKHMLDKFSWDNIAKRIITDFNEKK